MKKTSWISQTWYQFRLFLNNIKGGIQVLALIGPSGTGKSFRARVVADHYKIRFILDDGILVKDKKIIAGRSAKRENAYLAAVKVAIYADKVHRFEVRQALERQRCRRVLVLATSDRMIHKICDALGLPKPMKVIEIGEIASPEEIQKALENRKMYGRHVIPVPAKEVRRTSANIVTDEIKLWSHSGLLKTDKIYSKTLVRPEFSTGESLELTDNILKQAIRNTLEALVPGSRLASFKSRFENGYDLAMIVFVPFADLAPLPKIDELKIQITSQLKKQTGAFIKDLRLELREYRPRTW